MEVDLHVNAASKRPLLSTAPALGHRMGKIHDWTSADVASFLRQLSLERWLPLFEEVDGATLAQLADSDLKDIGCVELLPRKKLLGHVERMKLEAVASVHAAASDQSSCPQIAPASSQAELVAAPGPNVAETAAQAPEAAKPVVMALEDTTLRVMKEESLQVEALRRHVLEAVASLDQTLRPHQDGAALVKNFIQECMQDLKTAEHAATPNPVHIPLFGTTGAGKSTLLNATICSEVVPTSGWRSCTAVPVEIAGSASDTFEAEVQLKSFAEWQREVACLLDDMMMSDGIRVARREPVRGGDAATPAEVAYDTLWAVYPEVFESSRPWPSKAEALLQLQRTNNRVTKEHKRSQTLQFSKPSASELANHVLNYIESSDDSQAAFWPLVQRVRIMGPLNLHPNVVIVDAPGVQDSNSARGAVVKNLLEEAGGVVIVSAIKRAATEKVAQEMLGERFRRQMLMDGHYAGNLAFVATCTDGLTLSELRRNLEIDENVSQLDAARLRNQRTKEKIRADCYAGIRRVQAQAEENRSSDDELRSRVAPAVFTTSARDYQKLCGLLDTQIDGAPRVWNELVDTEVPEFRQWLHAQGQKAVLAAIRAGEDKLRIVCQKLQDAGRGAEQGVFNRWAHDARCKVQEAMSNSIETLSAHVRARLRKNLVGRLKVGQVQAAEAATQTMAPRCRPQGQGGMNHGTFKATARRKGEWKENWNELLADPLNRAIAMEWDRTLNTCLPECMDGAVRSLGVDLMAVRVELELPSPPFDEALKEVVFRGQAIKRKLQKRQMEVSRQIKENIQRLMGPSYATAYQQTGSGMDVRQKEIIRTQIETNGTSMFNEAATFIEEELDSIVDTMQVEFKALSENVLNMLERSMVRLCAKGEEMEALQKLGRDCGETVGAVLTSLKETLAPLQKLQALADEEDSRGRQKSSVEDASASGQAASAVISLAPVVPHEFLCPIMQEVMVDPVNTADGHAYEREGIEGWFQEHSTSPVTGLLLRNKDLVPNHSLRKLIEDFYLSTACSSESLAGCSGGCRNSLMGTTNEGAADDDAPDQAVPGDDDAEMPEASPDFLEVSGSGSSSLEMAEAQSHHAAEREAATSASSSDPLCVSRTAGNHSSGNGGSTNSDFVSDDLNVDLDAILEDASQKEDTASAPCGSLPASDEDELDAWLQADLSGPDPFREELVYCTDDPQERDDITDQGISIDGDAQAPDGEAATQQALHSNVCNRETTTDKNDHAAEADEGTALDGAAYQGSQSEKDLFGSDSEAGDAHVYGRLGEQEEVAPEAPPNIEGQGDEDLSPSAPHGVELGKTTAEAPQGASEPGTRAEAAEGSGLGAQSESVCSQEGVAIGANSYDQGSRSCSQAASSAGDSAGAGSWFTWLRLPGRSRPAEPGAGA